MQRKQKTNFTPTLRTFISKVITPVVLIAGLLVLVVFNFNGVLKAAQTTDNHFHGIVAFNNGAFSTSFKQNAGIDRPAVQYNGQELLTYGQWSSTLAVDGIPTDLWNTDQGYSIDEANKTIYNTVNSNNGWQLIQVTKMVNDHTITVTFNFTARPTTTVPPTHYELDIVHNHNFWYKPTVTNNSFTGNVMTSDPTQLQASDAKNIAASVGQVKLTTKAGDLPTAPQIKINNTYTTTTPNGTTLNWAKSFDTVYTIDNPAPSRMINLGTETITFTPVDTSHTSAIGSPVPAY